MNADAGVRGSHSQHTEYGVGYSQRGLRALGQSSFGGAWAATVAWYSDRARPMASPRPSLLPTAVPSSWDLNLAPQKTPPHPSTQLRHGAPPNKTTGTSGIQLDATCHNGKVKSQAKPNPAKKRTRLPFKSSLWCDGSITSPCILVELVNWKSEWKHRYRFTIGNNPSKSRCPINDRYEL